jgi:hypothetical protein
MRSFGSAGGRLIVVGTHVEANAALTSLRAELEVIDGSGEGSGAHGVSAGTPTPQRQRLELAAQYRARVATEP